MMGKNLFILLVCSPFAAAYLVERLNDKRNRDITFRFKGSDSRRILTNLSKMVSLFINEVQPLARKKLLEIHLSARALRKLISHTTRIEFSESQLEDMQKTAKILYRLMAACDKYLSPSMWVLTQCSPVHAAQCLQQYNRGLGMVSMEAHEQKHQEISRYMENTNNHSKTKWLQIFRHEFIQLIHLRERGSDDVNYRSRGTSYLPKYHTQNCSECGLKQCALCTDPCVADIMQYAEHTSSNGIPSSP